MVTENSTTPIRLAAQAAARSAAVERAQSVALRIALIRNKDGDRLVSLARRYGVDRSYLSHVVSGRRRANWLRVALAAAAGVFFEDFWGEPEPSLMKRDIQKLKNIGIEVGQ